jgi:hypothetical protein
MSATIVLWFLVKIHSRSAAQDKLGSKDLGALRACAESRGFRMGSPNAVLAEEYLRAVESTKAMNGPRFSAVYFDDRGSIHHG